MSGTKSNDLDVEQISALNKTINVDKCSALSEEEIFMQYRVMDVQTFLLNSPHSSDTGLKTTQQQIIVKKTTSIYYTLKSTVSGYIANLLSRAKVLIHIIKQSAYLLRIRMKKCST